MPLYRTTMNEGLSSEEQRARIADEIGRVHCDVTGAPLDFVNCFFSEVGPGGSEVGSGEIPEGKVVLMHATIRAGRTDEDKAKIVSDLTQSVANILGRPVDEVAFALDDFPAHWAMERGVVCPAPGTPEEAEWKERFG